MVPKEIERLIDELRAWCKAKRGRQAEAARKLGVTKETVHCWLTTGKKRKNPSAKHFLEIQAFLRKQRRSRK